ncbi:hypothetical protein [Aristaeella lactis]|uniref:Uncharacterized protein n=1 Tax=Aristaeella lactis TaxID=3046383 RepID=A0AC61PN14_9FIRM|nr:hypothetical protein [Aristaeella lactis]QUA52791.1 hypothetical protein JYE50_14040 [Aristaeella lactis]SMC73497.1 hypothetical protein SAMN06297397_2264 [Aristaeella lactis]
MTKKKPELPEGDDGRTVADMNVEGMPWYTPKNLLPKTERKQGDNSQPLLTKEESRYYTWGALKAALLVTGAICGGIALFILFCQFIWLR